MLGVDVGNPVARWRDAAVRPSTLTRRIPSLMAAS